MRKLRAKRRDRRLSRRQQAVVPPPVMQPLRASDDVVEDLEVWAEEDTQSPPIQLGVEEEGEEEEDV